ncbi:MAG TPA: hypothetical protein VJ697_12810 [Nitrososphaeraceae archaeon]|nr:hypothetical protein [Nitrososphaeraceae archaeon]
MLTYSISQGFSLLTKTELEWLTGKKKVSKVYEYRMRSDIKKKLQNFQQLELPLLIEKGFLADLSKYPQLIANTRSNLEQLLLQNNPISNDIHNLPYYIQSLGRKCRCNSTLSVLRPFPYQNLVTYYYLYRFENR